MPSREHSARDLRKESAPVPGAVTLSAALLLFVATAIAGYLAWISIGGGSAIGCGPDSGCDKVLHSKWAYWLGLPVSLLAIPVYLAVAISAIRLPAAASQVTIGITMTGALLLLGAAAWFTALQFTVIHALCRFCMSAHALGAVAAALLLWKGRGVRIEHQRVSIPWPPVVAAALVSLVALIAGQTVQHPKTYVVASIPASAPTNNGAPSVVLPVPVKADRLLPIYAGQYELKVGELPIIGSASAPHLIVSLFDYTCHHCRAMHGLLLDVQRSFSNQLGIISLPMPLDPFCNTNVIRGHPDHVNACGYARVGLALWRAKRSALAAYDEWIFAPDRPPPINEAREHAAKIVGTMPFEAALKDPWVDEQIRRDITIYETAYKAGQGSMPQLIISNKVAVGTLPIENIYQLLDGEFGLKLPAAKAQTPGAAH